MSVDPETHIEPTDETWREIDELVDGLTALSRTSVTPDVFYRELLDGTVRTLAAIGGAVWLSDQPGRLDMRYQIEFERLGLREPHEYAQHHALVAAAVSEGETRAFPPRAGSNGAGGVSNPTNFLLLVCPLLLDGQAVGALEIVQRSKLDPVSYRGHERVLAMVGELALEYQRDRQLAAYRRQLEQAEQLDRFACRVHAPLDPEAVAFEIANEGRRLIGCDRLSVAVAVGRRLRLAAISGVDLFDRRANMVRRLESLVRRVAASGEPFRYDGDWNSVPPQLDADLRAYLDDSHARSLAIIPLSASDDEDESEEARESARARASISPRPVGALVVERFEAGASGSAGAAGNSEVIPESGAAQDPEAARREATVARHSRVALRNAEEYASLPLLFVSRSVRVVIRQFQADRWPRSLAVLAALALLVAVLLLAPAPFRVESRGQLQPLHSQYIYAPQDGDVRLLLVEHNQPVAIDQPLLELASTDLELELQRVQTNRLTTKRQLESIGILRVTEDQDTGDPEARGDQLSAQELEAMQLLRSQERQIEIIQQQKRALTVRSPLNGRVLTWDLERLLKDRPVKRGELLMRVADIEGPWLAELEVPDHRIGHVLQAARDLRAAADAAPDAASDEGGELTVTFMLGTNPARTYRASIVEIGGTAVPDSEGRPVVIVKVRVDDSVPDRHPGATVIARIDCGRRSLGYVWLHDLIDTVRSRILF